MTGLTNMALLLRLAFYRIFFLMARRFGHMIESDPFHFLFLPNTGYFHTLLTIGAVCQHLSHLRYVRFFIDTSLSCTSHVSILGILNIPLYFYFDHSYYLKTNVCAISYRTQDNAEKQNADNTRTGRQTDKIMQFYPLLLGFIARI